MIPQDQTAAWIAAGLLLLPSIGALVWMLLAARNVGKHDVEHTPWGLCEEPGAHAAKFLQHGREPRT